MDTADLSRLEAQIGRLLRVGVVLCAIALGFGLALAFAGNAWASPLLRVGLAILMAIPVVMPALIPRGDVSQSDFDHPWIPSRSAPWSRSPPASTRSW